MVGYTVILFWAPVAFAVLVAASYVGTTLALRSYFEDEELAPSDFIRVGDGPGDRQGPG